MSSESLVSNIHYMLNWRTIPLDTRKRAMQQETRSFVRRAETIAQGRLLSIWQERVERMHFYHQKVKPAKTVKEVSRG